MAVDQFCLKWNNFQSSIISAFESLQSTEDLADVTLTTEGINVKAHKIILSACSPYFRTVFKENPCSHPIVILKDVLHDDLIAVLNFMYHGEVLVAKDRLHSFLQTAEVLQVSGLIGCTDFSIKSTLKSSFKQQKPDDVQQSPPKRTKVASKVKKVETCKTQDLPVKSKLDCQLDTKDTLEDAYTDKIKMEIEDEHLRSDVNENIGFCSNLADKSASILETFLETKNNSTSILERSLMSSIPVGKSPSGVYPIDTVIIQQPSSELAKHLAIPRKPPDSAEFDKRLTKSKFEYAAPLVSVDLSSDSSQNLKIEEENVEVMMDLPIVSCDPNQSNVRPPQDAQPHHSSQCGNCPHCGKVYSNQSALKYHVRLVHSDLLNLYCCHLCPEAFDFREGYKKHMVEVHNLRN